MRRSSSWRSRERPASRARAAETHGRPVPDPLASLTPAAGAFAIGGAAWGFLADRVAARWPVHEDGRVRALDWRTIAVSLVGAWGYGALAVRWGEPRDLAVLSIYLAPLVLLLATDLDQRLLPDLLTLPLIPAALLVVLAGWDPLLAGKQLGVASGIGAAVVYPLLLRAGSILFGGGLGQGDDKLLVSVGLMSGLLGFLQGMLAASLFVGAVLLLALATRRIGLRSYVPFGPIIVVAGIVAAIQP